MSRFKPYLDAHLDLGFVGFHTIVMKHAYERFQYDYIRVSWYFFRWKGGFNLYKPGEVK